MSLNMKGNRTTSYAHKLRLESKEHSLVLNAIQTLPSCNSSLQSLHNQFPHSQDTHSMVMKGSSLSELVSTIPEIPHCNFSSLSEVETCTLELLYTDLHFLHVNIGVSVN